MNTEQAAMQPLILANSHLMLGFAPRTGNLLALRNPRGGHDWLAAEPAGTPFWAVQLRTAAGETVVLAPNEQARFTAAAEAHALSLHWEMDQDSIRLAVTVTIRLPEDERLSRWEMDASAAGAKIEHVSFPGISGLRAAADAEAEVLAMPQGSGVCLRGPRPALAGGSGAPFGAPYPGFWTMQFSAYAAPEAGCLYVAAEDGAGYYKYFQWQAAQDGAALAYTARHYPDAPCERYRVPYPMTVGLLPGDYWQAVACYREWAKAQVWCGAGKLTEREAPAFLKQTGPWLWNRGDLNAVPAAARSLRKALGLPIRLHWYWWHDAPYDTGFPDYLPPRGGTEAFQRETEALAAEGITAEVYVNGVFVGDYSRAWEEKQLSRYACKDADGKEYRQVFNTFANQPLLPMCPTAPEWQNLLEETLQGVEKLGTAGVYLDCIGCAVPAICYDKTHAHPGAYGNFWLQAYRQFIPRLRKAVPRLAVTTESCAEPYMDLFDGYLVLDVSFDRYGWLGDRFGERWEPIPLFTGVYHEYIRIFGAYAQPGNRQPYDPKWPPRPEAAPASVLDGDYSDYCRYELARIFLWGHQMMLANWEAGMEKKASIQRLLGFLRDLAQAREALRDYLDCGRLHGLLDAGGRQQSLSCLINWLYLAPNDARVIERIAPAVLAAAWENPAGRRAILLVNHTEEAAPYQVRLPEAWREIRWRTAEDGAVVEEGILPPLSLRIFEEA